jgi:hypothetical protein
MGTIRLSPSRSKRSGCKAARKGPSEAYTGYAAASAEQGQRRWAVFALSDGADHLVHVAEFGIEPLRHLALDAGLEGIDI